MGAIAELITTYAQPLLDDADGSIEQINDALALGQICWNLSLMPEEERKKTLRGIQPKLKMKDNEFEVFRRTVVLPMVQRHQEMFPSMHQSGSTASSQGISRSASRATTLVSKEKYPGTRRNAPCPCNSGKKYKRCCGG